MTVCAAPTRVSASLAVLLLLFAYAADAWSAGATDDLVRNGVRLSQLREHPVRSARYWRQAGHDFADGASIGPAPAELIEFMRLDNTFQGYAERPVPAHPDSEFIQDVEAAVASLPPQIRAITDRTVFFIALIRDLGGGSGYTDVVGNDDGSAAGGFIALDEGALDRTANAWASWKESSAFRPSGDRSLEVIIEAPANDNRVNAIRYILLHELGHVVDAVLGVSQIDGGNTQNIAANGFYGLSWTHPPPSQPTLRPGDALRSRFDTAWPGRKRLAFYAFDESRYDLGAAPTIYGWLRQTNFPTLYAATSSADDFAESFANYVHDVLGQRPFEIRLRRGESAELLFDSCWDSVPCATKKAKLAQLLERLANQDSPGS